jgi:hypothetical protein
MLNAKLIYIFSYILFTLVACLFVKHQLIFLLSVLGSGIILFSFLFNKVRFGINNIFLFGFFYFMFLYPILYSLGITDIPKFESRVFLETTAISFFALVIYTIFNINYSNGKYINNIAYKRPSISTSQNIFFILLSFIVYGVLSIAPQMIFNKDIILFTSLLLFTYFLPKRSYFLVYIIFIVFFINIVIMSDGRRDLLKILIIFLLFYQIYYGNIKLITLFIFFLLSIFGMILITALRTFNTGWSYHKDVGILEILTNNTYIDRITSGYGDYFQNALILGDFGVGYNNFVYIYNNISEIGYLYGQSLIRILYTWIPRSIWESKPYDVQLQIVKLNTEPFYTGGSSQSVTFIGEVFWNYGLIAIIIVFVLLGRILLKIDNNLYRLHNYQLLALLSIAPFFMLMWRGSFTTTLVYALANFIVIYFCYFFSRIKFIK